VEKKRKQKQGGGEREVREKMREKKLEIESGEVGGRWEGSKKMRE